MSKNTPIWILIVLLILIFVIAAPLVLSYGRGYSMHPGYGMMGPGMMGLGMMGFGWVVPALLLILVIAGGVWLGNSLSSRKHHSRPQPVCPNCSKPTEGDWTTCPYCSEPLKK